MSLFARLEEGRKPSKSELSKGKKPKDVTWKDWLTGGGAFQGKVKHPKKPKRKKLPKGAYQDVFKQGQKLTKARVKAKKGKNDWWTQSTKGMSFFDPDDDFPDWWGSSSKLPKLPKLPPPPPLTAEEKKIRELAKSIGRVHRVAAGGLVFKSFAAPEMWEMLVLVSKAHPRFGGYWTFPKGGLDLGEHIYSGAAREVYEEAGVKAKVANPLAFKNTAKFGDRGKYDLPLVIDLMKKKNPKDKKFIEENKEKFKDVSFTWSNHAHYFVMLWKSGRPRKTPDKHQEMAMSEWVTLAEAIKRGDRMKRAVKFLTPVIHKMWKPTGGVPKPSRPTKPPKWSTKKPSYKPSKLSKPSKPYKPYKPSSGKQTKSYSLFY